MSLVRISAVAGLVAVLPLAGEAEGPCDAISAVTEAAHGPLPFAAYGAGPHTVYKLEAAIGRADCNTYQAEAGRPAMSCSSRWSPEERYSTSELTALRSEYFGKASQLIAAIKACPGFDTWTATQDEITALDSPRADKDARLTDPVTGQQIISRTEVYSQGSKGRYQYRVRNRMIFPALKE
ncbi:hypothetical protein [Henriciella litoralis]|uniref:hypothetical protein n=1 Tax=Henriciella litoralis TaxID=568102 RepID=UPI000A015069|nr:hypothetical protein [Henriciella litoralis]